MLAYLTRTRDFWNQVKMSHHDVVTSLLTITAVVTLFLILCRLAMAYFAVGSADVETTLTTMVVLGILGTLSLSFVHVTRSHNAARGAAVEFYLVRLQSGDFEAAYRKLCPEARKRETLAAFIERQQAYPRLRDFGNLRLLPQAVSQYYAGPEQVEADLCFIDGTCRKEGYTVSTYRRLLLPPRCVDPGQPAPG